MKNLFRIAMLALLLFVQRSNADVLVLVHGYLGAADSWDRTGITAILQQHGWTYAGVATAGPAGIGLIPIAGDGTAKSFYTVDLPSEAPVLVQVNLLHEVLNRLVLQHADEPVVLVGHSAGGVVARAALIGGGHPSVKTLITIASPHLGTGRAEEALDAIDIPFPISVLTDFFGGSTYHTAVRSRSLYADLMRPYPGSLLYWLNAQPHPDIRYISVVRAMDGPGDFIVPPYSQDMNNVPVLQGRSALVAVPAQHGLEPLDGSVLAGLLDDTR